MEIRPTLGVTVAGILMAAIFACALAVRILFPAMPVSAGAEPIPASDSNRAEVLREGAKSSALGEKITPHEFLDFVEGQNHGATTGLKVGQKVPDFTCAPELDSEEVFRSGRTIWTAAGIQSQRRLVTASTAFDSTDIRNSIPRFSADARKANLALVDLLGKLAERKKATPAQIALAWLLAQKPWIVPIPGTRRLERLDENNEAAAVELTSEDLREIESAASKIEVQGVRYPEHPERMKNL